MLPWAEVNAGDGEDEFVEEVRDEWRDCAAVLAVKRSARGVVFEVIDVTGFGRFFDQGGEDVAEPMVGVVDVDWVFFPLKVARRVMVGLLVDRCEGGVGTLEGEVGREVVYEAHGVVAGVEYDGVAG